MKPLALEFRGKRNKVGACDCKVTETLVRKALCTCGAKIRRSGARARNASKAKQAGNQLGRAAVKRDTLKQANEL